MSPPTARLLRHWTKPSIVRTLSGNVSGPGQVSPSRKGTPSIASVTAARRRRVAESDERDPVRSVITASFRAALAREGHAREGPSAESSTAARNHGSADDERHRAPLPRAGAILTRGRFCKQGKKYTDPAGADDGLLTASSRTQFCVRVVRLSNDSAASLRRAQAPCRASARRPFG